MVALPAANATSSLASVQQSPAFTDVLASAAQRAQACNEANLALKAGLGALEDARQKVRQRLTSVTDGEANLREGLREALVVIGHLVTMTQGQVPVSDGQLMEARYTYSSLASLADARPAGAGGDEVLKKAAS